MMFSELLDMIQDDVRHNTHRSMALSAMLQLLIVLRHYATGAFQVSVKGLHAYIFYTINTFSKTFIEYNKLYRFLYHFRLF